MGCFIFSIFFVFLLDLSSSFGSKCGPEFEGKCFCGEQMYQDKRQFVVNCSNTGFRNTSMLEHMPEQTQVLIFTGNNIPELPKNIFGAGKNYTKLRIIDMSNNNIKQIPGKSFHGVPIVERLVLNHNQISLSEDHPHPRIFSNFINLLELHLTNAFEENSENLSENLHDIFVDSELKRLVKLHLEQNEIKMFKYRSVFCDLTNLMDLHLGQNLLTGIDFDTLCLSNLRFLDLESNKITKLSSKELKVLDKFIERNQSFAIDFGGNPFICDCDIPEFYTWLQDTKVVVRNKDQLRCFHGNPEDNNGKPVVSLRKVQCESSVLTSSAGSQAVTILLLSLTIILIGIVAGVVYLNRFRLRSRLDPILNTVSRKVYYTSIGKEDNMEVDV